MCDAAANCNAAVGTGDGGFHLIVVIIISVTCVPQISFPSYSSYQCVRETEGKFVVLTPSVLGHLLTTSFVCN